MGGTKLGETATPRPSAVSAQRLPATKGDDPVSGCRYWSILNLVMLYAVEPKVLALLVRARFLWRFPYIPYRERAQGVLETGDPRTP